MTVRVITLCISAWLCIAIASSVCAQFPDPDDPTAPYYAQYYHGLDPPGDHFLLVSNFSAAAGGMFQLGGLWIGAVRGRDTIVAVANDGWLRFGEFNPESYNTLRDLGKLPIHRSIADDSEKSQYAKSLDDVQFTYYHGTGLRDSLGLPLHVDGALNIEITQSSYYWPVDYAERIALVNFGIKYFGAGELRDVFVGYFFDGLDNEFPPDREGSVIGTHGFIQGAQAHPYDSSNCGFVDDYELFWYAHVDGRPNLRESIFDSTSLTDATAVFILAPDDKLRIRSVNWWLSNGNRRYDFGPRKRATPGKPFRDWGVLGTPLSAGDRYHILSNGEIDYDQFTTALDHSGEGWLPPPPNADSIAFGRFDTHALYSIGPFNLKRGQEVDFTIAIVGAESVHITPQPLREKFDPYNPAAYLRDHFDFSELLRNATWARWIYDNPGYDTDGDGYRGDYRLCATDDSLVVDTVTVIDSTGSPIDTHLILDTTVIAGGIDTEWINGDGVPDFRGAAPPAPPEVRFTPAHGRIELLWNGLRSESERDFFTRDFDFEGYRVYRGFAERFDDLQLVSSYDRENYTQYRLVEDDTLVWKVLRRPFTLMEARAAYAPDNPDWHPLLHDQLHPLTVGDSTFYFSQFDWNESGFRDTTEIHKVYPDAPYPHTLNIDSAFTGDTLWTNPRTDESVFYEGGELTPDRLRFKYFEWCYVFRNVLPSLPLYLAVSAFDYGAPAAGLPGLESNRLDALVEALAQEPTTQEQPLDVIVYPNPYRVDGNYRALGFEGRGEERRTDERVRAVHFTNLPPVCDIKIYSLDGDLVRQIIHDKAPDDPSAMHDSWDVISRNLQVPVSGIYYWVVTTPEGLSQIGKLVLIM